MEQDTQKPENPLWANLPARLEAIKEFGEIWARSGAIKADRKEHGIAAAAYCMASGITPLEFMATYDLVDGVPRKKAMACLADFRQRGGVFKWVTAPDDQDKATGEFTYSKQTIKVTFTLEDARKQGLVKGGSNWMKSPSYMLRARVSTTAIGMLAPEIVAGAEAAPDEAPSQTPELQLPKIRMDEHPNAPEEEEKVLAKLGLAPVEATLPDGEKISVAMPVDDKHDKPKKELANAGKELANAEKEPAKGKKELAKGGKRRSISIPAPGEDDDGKGEPIEPAPSTIEPQAAAEPAPPTKGPEMESGAEELSPDIVDQMGHIFQGNFVKVANWMVKEKWIPEPEKDLNTEAQAAVHLQRNLPKLSQAKAKKVLTKKMAFMRAVATIEP